MAGKKNTKRVQIDKSKARLFAVVVVASFISVGALVVSKGIFSEASYLNRVAGEKEKAVKQLKANKSAVSSLTESYKTFATQDPNLLGGKIVGVEERDGDNGRLILDALPSSYDFPALATSLEKLLAGYKINSINGNDDVATQAEVQGPEAIEMPFLLNVTTDYTGLQTLISSFDRSIRPIQITSIQLTGTNATLQANISAKTFYQPAHGLQIEKKDVK